MRAIVVSILALQVSACNAPEQARAVLVDGGTFELQRIVDEVHRQTGTPALAAAWIRSSGPSHVAIAGIRDVTTRQVAQTNDHFPVGSIAQQFSNIVIASLIEEGQLRWDTSVGEMLPELAPDIRPEHGTATIEQLMTHRTRIPGLTRSVEEPSFDWPSSNVRQQRQNAVRWALGRAPSPNPQGPRLADIHALTAVHLAEHKMNTPFEDMVRERLLKRIYPSDCATPHTTVAGTVEIGLHTGTPAAPAAAPATNPDRLPPLFTPVAGIHCSVEGLVHFAAAQLRGLRGANQAVTAASFQRLHTPSTEGVAALPATVAHVFGTKASSAAASTVFQLSSGRRAIWQGAGAQSYATWMTLLPEDDLAIVVAANAGFGDDACARVTRDVLAAMGIASP